MRYIYKTIIIIDDPIKISRHFIYVCRYFGSLGASSHYTTGHRRIRNYLYQCNNAAVNHHPNARTMHSQYSAEIVSIATCIKLCNGVKGCRPPIRMRFLIIKAEKRAHIKNVSSINAQAHSHANEKCNRLTIAILNANQDENTLIMPFFMSTLGFGYVCNS